MFSSILQTALSRLPAQLPSGWALPLGGFAFARFHCFASSLLMPAPSPVAAVLVGMQFLPAQLQGPPESRSDNSGSSRSAAHAGWAPASYSEFQLLCFPIILKCPVQRIFSASLVTNSFSPLSHLLLPITPLPRPKQIACIKSLSAGNTLSAFSILDWILMDTPFDTKETEAQRS